MSFWFSWCTWMQTYVNTTTIHYTYISLCFTYYFHIHHAYIHVHYICIHTIYIYTGMRLYIYIFNPLSQANLAASSGQDDPTLGMDQVWRRWQASVNPKKIRFQVLAIKWLTKIGHFWCNLSVNFLKKWWNVVWPIHPHGIGGAALTVILFSAVCLQKTYEAFSCDFKPRDPLPIGIFTHPLAAVVFEMATGNKYDPTWRRPPSLIRVHWISSTLDEKHLTKGMAPGGWKGGLKIPLKVIV